VTRPFFGGHGVVVAVTGSRGGGDTLAGGHLLDPGGDETLLAGFLPVWGLLGSHRENGEYEEESGL
jgi:hypothetical protein